MRESYGTGGSEYHPSVARLVQPPLRRSPRRKAPLFVYLISSKQTNIYIGISKDPFSSVETHNRNGAPCGPKGTRSGAPHWRIELIVGPFYRGAKQFKKEWRLQSRKLVPRIVHGVAKACHFQDRGLRVWARDPVWVESMFKDPAKKRRSMRKAAETEAVVHCCP